jgi:hypothetical protein
MSQVSGKTDVNLRKTDSLTELWHNLGGGSSPVTIDSLLQGLNGERQFCVHGNLDSKRHVVQVAEVGALLVNRLGEGYRAPSGEQGVAEQILKKLSNLGKQLLSEETPIIGQGAIARAGARVHYRAAAVPVINGDSGSAAWFGIVDWSHRAS